MDIPGIVIAALRGGSGKTIFSIGIIAALKNLGRAITPFKKGPDYIDAGWLALAAGRPCYNLDTYLIEEEQILSSFCSHANHNDIAVIEGNRGLYDCIDTEGKTSTAELAKLLNLPVILCIDCTKTTRTMAAVVSGLIQFDPDIRIRGVILNRIAGPRHESILRRSIEEYTGVPVLGAVPKLSQQSFPERHMGLVPTPEHDWAMDSINAITRVTEQNIDIQAVVGTAEKTVKDRSSADLKKEFKIDVKIDSPPREKAAIHSLPRIGIIRDSAFQFYYPENIEALKKAGAEIVFTSPLTENSFPQVDALYIGGGFPETHANTLAENKIYRNQLKNDAENNMPIYAECGGLMYLGEKLILDDVSYTMAGVLPVVFGFSRKPQGHGYTIVDIVGENPYYDVGTEIKGHEFHYSTVLEFKGEEKNLVFRMKRGNGLVNKKDGLCYKNVLATYTHIHALGTPLWANALVQNAKSYQDFVNQKPK